MLDDESLQLHLIDSDFSQQLIDECDAIIHQNGYYIITHPQTQPPVFAKDTWYDIKTIEIESINHAAKQLKPLARIWFPLLGEFARRTVLIADKLRSFKLKPPYDFPLGSIPDIAQFTLLDKNTLLYSLQRKKSLPNGDYRFIEDKKGPPNRAYLKLWEALSLMPDYPKAGELVLDAGASPGGWTYVMQQFGCRVLAIDKAPLDPKILRLKNVDYQSVSAFSLSPDDFDHVDWLICDMACYPERLYPWLKKWIDSGKVKHFIITIKLQGPNDHSSIKPFKSIASNSIYHLGYNKHEVTLLI